MRPTRPQWLVLIGIAALSEVALAATDTARVAPAAAASPPRLTVVELFQSQSCSDCPPAETNINALARAPNVLALSYGVTYWDQLGWKDTFATPQFTARQWDYAHRRNRANVWTPQVFVNGQADIVGSNRTRLDQTIAASRVSGPAVAIRANQVIVGKGPPAAHPATIWLVRYDPRTIDVPIRAGENGGRTLPHRNIVRELVSLGRWTGASATFAIPPAKQPGLAVAAIVQDGVGGAIVGAAKG